MDQETWLEALIVGSGGLALGSLMMLVPTTKFDRRLWPLVGIFITGFSFHVFWKEWLQKKFSAELVSGTGQRFIEGAGDINTGGTKDFNRLYLTALLPEELLKPARGWGLDFSDQ